MLKTYDDLYRELVTRSEKERSLEASTDPKVVALRIFNSTRRDAGAERAEEIGRAVAAFGARVAR